VFRFVLFVALVSGCSSPPPDPPPVPPPVGLPLTLGMDAGDQSFVAFTDGEDVTLVEGAQGGFHVWVRYRYGGEAGVTARLERTAHRQMDDALVLRSTAQVGMVPESDPLPMFMCPSPVGLSVIDQPIVFQLQFSDDNGAVLAEGAATLVPRCPEANRDFCLRICTG